MIKALELENFQSHKKTRLDFEEGVNVIIGPSDTGKSSIIRILRWILWNQPLGNAFRSNWGGDTIGRVYFDDGIHVERFKGTNDHYLLGYEDPEIEDLVFKAFGTTVPEEVVEALNMNEINMQQQMDSTFLLSETSGEVARHFNKVARIDKIDSSLRAVESWIRSLNSEIKHVEDDIENHREKLKEFEYLDQMEAEVEVLEQLETRRNKQGNTIQGINKVLQSMESIQRQIKEKSTLLPAIDPINKLLDQIEYKQDKITKYKKIKSVCKNIKIINQQTSELNDLVKRESFIKKMLSLYNNITEQQQEYDSLETLIQKLSNNSEFISNKKKSLKQLENKWHKQAPETCPLCDGSGSLK